MKMDTRLLDAIEMIAASTWATEAVLRALERGEIESASRLLEDARRPLRRGLRDLRRALDDSIRADVTVNGDMGQALDGVLRLEELMGRRVA